VSWEAKTCGFHSRYGKAPLAVYRCIVLLPVIKTSGTKNVTYNYSTYDKVYNTKCVDKKADSTANARKQDIKQKK
jgi:hypothetical protein